MFYRNVQVVESVGSSLQPMTTVYLRLTEADANVSNISERVQEQLVGGRQAGVRLERPLTVPQRELKLCRVLHGAKHTPSLRLVLPRRVCLRIAAVPRLLYRTQVAGWQGLLLRRPTRPRHLPLYPPAWWIGSRVAAL